jgi:hypothetical protein
MTNFSERRIHSAKNQNAQLCHAEIFRSGSNPTFQSLAKLEGASPDAPKFFRQCSSTAIQNFSPFATRYSLLFYHSPLAICHSPSFSARQEPRPPIFPVPRPTTLVLLKVGAQFLRHQLRTKVRSMICFWLHHQLGLMPPVSLAQIQFKSQRTCSTSKRRKGR